MKLSSYVPLVVFCVFVSNAVTAQDPSQENVQSLLEWSAKLDHTSCIETRRESLRLNQKFLNKLEKSISDPAIVENDEQRSYLYLSMFYVQNRAMGDEFKLWQFQSLAEIEETEEDQQAEKAMAYLKSFSKKSIEMEERYQKLVNSYLELITEETIRAQFEEIISRHKSLEK